METLIVHPKSKEQLSVLKAVIKALKIEFETEKSPYNPNFVAKIQRGEKQIREGKGIKVDMKTLFK